MHPRGSYVSAGERYWGIERRGIADIEWIESKGDAGCTTFHSCNALITDVDLGLRMEESSGESSAGRDLWSLLRERTYVSGPWKSTARVCWNHVLRNFIDDYLSHTRQRYASDWRYWWCSGRHTGSSERDYRCHRWCSSQFLPSRWEKTIHLSLTMLWWGVIWWGDEGTGGEGGMEDERVRGWGVRGWEIEEGRVRRREGKRVRKRSERVQGWGVEGEKERGWWGCERVQWWEDESIRGCNRERVIG